METIYLKIKIKKTETELDEIREQGIFFEQIADTLNIDRKQIIEIDESNYKKEIEKINRKYNDKS